MISSLRRTYSSSKDGTKVHRPQISRSSSPKKNRVVGGRNTRATETKQQPRKTNDRYAEPQKRLRWIQNHNDDSDPTEDCTETSWAEDNEGNHLIFEVHPVGSRNAARSQVPGKVKNVPSTEHEKVVKKQEKKTSSVPSEAVAEKKIISKKVVGTTRKQSSRAAGLWEPAKKIGNARKLFIRENSPSKATMAMWLKDDALLAKPVFQAKMAPPAVVIQTAFRGYTQRKAYPKLLEEYRKRRRYKAATRMAALARAFLAQRQFQKDLARFRAARLIQACVRGKLVWKRMRARLLRRKLARIERLKQKDLKNIQSEKEKSMSQFAREEAAKQAAKDNDTAAAEEERQRETQFFIHRLRQENKELRAENERLREGIQCFAEDNYKLELQLEWLRQQTVALRATLQKLERDAPIIAKLEKQFRERRDEYEESYREGAQLVKLEQSIKRIYWNSICHMAETAQKRQESRSSKRYYYDVDWAKRIQWIALEAIGRDPLSESNDDDKKISDIEEKKAE